MNAGRVGDVRLEREAAAGEMKRMIQKMNWTCTYIDFSEYVTFRLGYDCYGLKKDSVHEVIDLPAGNQLIRDAGSLPFSINHRGRRIPVYNMTPEHDRDCFRWINGSDNAIIIVKIRDDLMGMIVSRGTDVIGVY